jgi:hypothetical protein
MENEYMKRGYLLPPGCKDLSDVLKHKRNPWAEVPTFFMPELATGHDTANWEHAPLPPIKGQVFIPSGTTVKKLAALLGEELYQINGDLMQLGLLAFEDSLIDFKTISKVARMYGFTAIKAA